MPTSITVIASGDKLEPDSRVNINNNFASLNTNKLEVANNLSDVASKPTAINNILPDQSSSNGSFLTTNGSVASWGSPTGVPDASTTVKGIARISATPANPAIPIALGVNDVKAPQVDVSAITADKVAALAGSGTPSASNKYLTTDTFTTEQGLTEKVANKDATTTLGTSDTKYPSQKAVKTYVDTNSGLLFKAATASANLKVSNDTERTVSSTTYLKSKETMIFYAGTIRVVFDIKTGGSSNATYGRIYVNGVAVGTERQHDGDTNYSTVATEDITVEPYDLVQIYLKNAVNVAYVRNFRISYDLGAGNDYAITTGY